VQVLRRKTCSPGEPVDVTGLIPLEAGGYQPLLGKSYPEIAAASRSMHKSQGFGVEIERGERKEYFKFLDGEPVAEIPVPAEISAPVMSAPAATAAEQLVTRDTVGRSVAPVATQVMPVPQVSKRAEKRRVREERRVARQAYQVPSESGGRRDTRPVIVVRPLRLETFSR